MTSRSARRLNRATLACVATVSLALSATTVPAAFAADATATTSATATTTPEAASEASITAPRPGFVYDTGTNLYSIINVSGTGFKPGDVLSAKINDLPAQFFSFLGSGKPTPTSTVGDDGTVEVSVITLATAVPAGVPATITLTGTSGTTASTPGSVNPKVTIGSPDAPGISQTAIGSTAVLGISGLVKGSVITRVGTKTTNFLSAPATINDTAHDVVKGIAIPNDASLIGQPLSVSYRPAGSDKDVELKLRDIISSPSPVKDSTRVTTSSQELGRGLYQSVYSAKQNAMFVTRSVFVGDDLSTIYKVDPQTLKVLATYTPHPEGSTKGDSTSSAFGVGLVDSLDQLWVTNTLGDTVSVYSTVDGSLIKQFPHGTVEHPRAITVDPDTNTVYVSQPTSKDRGIAVFDAATLAQKDDLKSDDFLGAMDIIFDKDSQSLYTVGLRMSKAAKIDVKTGKATVYDLGIPEGAYRGGGVALDTKHNRLFVTAQIPSQVKVIDLNTGAVTTTLTTGAGSLDAHYDANSNTVAIANRGSGTVTILDADTYDVVANTKVGYYPNHISRDSSGALFVVDKPSSGGAADKDSITKIEIAPAPAPTSDPLVSSTPSPEPGQSPEPTKEPSEDTSSQGSSDGKDDAGNKDGDHSSADSAGPIAAIIAVLTVLGVLGFALNAGSLKGLIPAGMTIPGLPQ